MVDILFQRLLNQPSLFIFLFLSLIPKSRPFSSTLQPILHYPQSVSAESNDTVLLLEQNTTIEFFQKVKPVTMMNQTYTFCEKVCETKCCPHGQIFDKSQFLCEGSFLHGTNTSNIESKAIADTNDLLRMKKLKSEDNITCGFFTQYDMVVLSGFQNITKSTAKEIFSCHDNMSTCKFRSLTTFKA